MISPRQIINQLEPLEIVDFKLEPAQTPAPKLITMADPINSAKKGVIKLIFKNNILKIINLTYKKIIFYAFCKMKLILQWNRHDQIPYQQMLIQEEYCLLIVFQVQLPTGQS